MSNIPQLDNRLKIHGIPQPERNRAIDAQVQIPTPYAMPWPGPVTGLDLAGRINSVITPDSGTPTINLNGLPQNRTPYPTPNKSPYGIGTSYPSAPTPDPNSVGNTSNIYDVTNTLYPGDNTNWTATGAQPNSEPSMHGEHGFTVAKAIPEWQYPIEQSQMSPIIPNVKIPNVIIPPSGTSPPYQYTRKIQEAIAQIRSEFDWLTDDYITKARELAADSGGQLYLIRAASETITDHTSEGEKYRRKLSGCELSKMARTAVGKSMDINHQPENETDSIVIDSEYDDKRKQIQMLVIEKDSQINRAISNGQIEAVSINGGMPRSESVEPCNNNCTVNCEMCNVPKGVVLGELDGIALTWVVTDPNGIVWDGKLIDQATPGIKNTVIEII